MNTNKNKKIVAAALALFSFASLSAQTTQSQPPAGNQEATAADEVIELPEFLTTASKVARPVREEPMSLQTINGKAIDEFKMFNAKDLASVSPGLNVDSTSVQNPTPSLRGITYNSFSGSSPTVDFYWNEVPITAATAFQGLYDVDQLEVLRGPQGDLRGRTSPGGAILISTRKADLNSYKADLQQSFSDRDLINSQLMVNIPLVSGKLALRLAGLYDGNSGDNIGFALSGHDSRSHTRSLRATLAWKPTEDIEFTLVGQKMYNEINQGFPAVGTNVFSATRPELPAKLTVADRKSLVGADSIYKSNSELVTLTAAWKLPGKNTLNVVGGLSRNRGQWDFINGDQVNMIPGYLGRQVIGTDTLPATKSLELRFSSENHKFWDYIFGAYLEHTPDSTSRIDVTNGALVAPGTAEPGPTYGTIFIQGGTIVGDTGDQRAVFTRQTLKFTKDLKLEVGARVSRLKSASTTTMPAYISLPNIPPAWGGGTTFLGATTGSTNINARPVTGTSNLSYRVTPEINVYFAYGRSYRPANDGLNSIAGQIDTALPASERAALAELSKKYFHFEEEKSDSYELGIKTSLFGNKLQLNADAFYQKFKNYQSYATVVPFRNSLTATTSTGTVAASFSGDAIVKGVEIGLTQSFPYRIILNIDASYNVAEWASGAVIPGTISDGAGNAIFPNAGELVAYTPVGGKEIGSTPKFTATTRLEWSYPVRKYEVFTRGLLRYKSSRTFPANTFRMRAGGYALTDLYAGLRSKNGAWDVTLWLKNALNKQTEDSFTDDIRFNSSPAGQTWISGYHMAVLTPARELGVSMGYHF